MTNAVTPATGADSSSETVKPTDDPARSPGTFGGHSTDDVVTFVGAFGAHKQ